MGTSIGYHKKLKKPGESFRVTENIILNIFLQFFGWKTV